MLIIGVHPNLPNFQQVGPTNVGHFLTTFYVLYFHKYLNKKYQFKNL